LTAHPQSALDSTSQKSLDGRHSKPLRSFESTKNLAFSNLLSLRIDLARYVPFWRRTDPFPVPPAPIHRSSAENLLDGRGANSACPSSLPPSKDARPPGLSSFDHGLKALPRQIQPGRPLEAFPDRFRQLKFVTNLPVAPFVFPSVFGTTRRRERATTALPCAPPELFELERAWNVSVPAPRTSRSFLLEALSQSPAFEARA